MKAWAIKNTETGALFGAKSFYVTSEFASESAAKAAITRYSKKHSDIFNSEDHEVVLLSEYVEPQVTRTKRFPGTGETKTYTIGINSVGTCTDPATETYWSM
jgi:hypothetical protein